MQEDFPETARNSIIHNTYIHDFNLVVLSLEYPRRVGPTSLQYTILFDVGNGDNQKSFAVITGSIHTHTHTHTHHVLLSRLEFCLRYTHINTRHANIKHTKTHPANHPHSHPTCTHASSLSISHLLNTYANHRPSLYSS